MPEFAGFFEGTRYSRPGDPKLIPEELAPETAAAVAVYLRSGQVFAASPMRSRDLLDTSVKLESLEYLTDGDWVWPSDLIYYVENYRVAVPNEFVARALDRGEVAKPISQATLDQAQAAYQARAAG
jgi:hypothetical protein